MEKMEEEIWNLIQKCHLESLFWKVTGHSNKSNSVIEILYRKEEQKYEIIDYSSNGTFIEGNTRLIPK